MRRLAVLIGRSGEHPPGVDERAARAALYPPAQRIEVAPAKAPPLLDKFLDVAAAPASSPAARGPECSLKGQDTAPGPPLNQARPQAFPPGARGTDSQPTDAKSTH